MYPDIYACKIIVTYHISYTYIDTWREREREREKEGGRVSHNGSSFSDFRPGDAHRGSQRCPCGGCLQLGLSETASGAKTMQDAYSKQMGNQLELPFGGTNIQNRIF